jgi:predicted outer membrane repeat protein
VNARLTASLVLILVLPAHAATIHVPGDQPTIAAGISAAAAGDTVLVAAGTYTGPNNKNLTIAKEIVLLSESGPASTVIDCEGSGRGFLVVTGATPATLISGFTVCNGNPGGAGGAAFCAGASPTFSDCVFDGNVGTGDLGGGGGAVFCTNSSASFEGCTISNNQLSPPGGIGGGMSLYECSMITLTNCSFENNSTLPEGFTPAGGGLASVSGNSIVITRCVFENNFSPEGGGAIFLNTPQVLIESTTFAQNTAEFVGGGLASSVSPLMLIGCVFDRNHATIGGAAYATHAITVAVDQCTFYGNEANAGAALALQVESEASLSKSIFADNLGAAVQCFGAISVDCCDVHGNEGGDWVGCIASQANINGNFSSDPLFCDPENGDFTIRSDSPCAPPGVTGCGLVGALPVGCGPIALEETSWGAIKNRYR